MEILESLTYIKQLIETYRFDAAINEMRDLMDSQTTSLEELEELIHAESINDLIYNKIDSDAYGWMSVGRLLGSIEDEDAMWFQFERGRLKNLTEEAINDLFNRVVDTLKNNLEWEFSEEINNVVELLNELLEYYREKALDDEADTLAAFISDLEDTSIEGFMLLFNKFQKLIIPVQLDESITLSPELNACLTTATESMDALKDYLEYFED